MRAQIVLLKRIGWSWAQIRSALEREFGRNVSRSTCQRVVRKYEETGSVEDRPRSGRLQKLTQREIRLVRRTMLADRRKSLRQMRALLKSTGTSACRNTIKRVLAKYDLRRRAAVRRPLLTARMREARLKWAKERVNWSIEKWKSVIFTDEKIFRVGNHSRTAYVTRLPSEKYAPACLQSTVKHGLQVHVWGAIGWNGVSELKLVRGNLNAAEYQESIIHDIQEVGQSIAIPQCRFVFQQDNAPAHSAQSTQRFLSDEGCRTLPWCGNSPDLNPIENAWAVVARAVNYNVSSKDELFRNVCEAWSQIDVSYLRRLYKSMPRRMAAVVAARGGSTRY